MHAWWRAGTGEWNLDVQFAPSPLSGGSPSFLLDLSFPFFLRVFLQLLYISVGGGGRMFFPEAGRDPAGISVSRIRGVGNTLHLVVPKTAQFCI